MIENDLVAFNLKRCNRCHRTQHMDQFRRCSRMADGHYNQCRGCGLAYAKARLNANPEFIRERNRIWVAKNVDRVRARYLKHRAENRERIDARSAAWIKANPDRARELTRRKNARRRASTLVKLHDRIAGSIRAYLRGEKGGAKTEALIGWSMLELRDHLERQFTKGMSWDNMSEWHIDHIVPLSSFSFSGVDDPEIRRAWALTNLRPLWASANVKKGAARTHLI